LSPGTNPNANLQFLTFFINTIKAVHDSADILRASIASAANDHRLGANEAPPAIISVFVGSTLTEVLDDFASGKEDINGKSGRTISIENIPEILADNTDRNRTSPFAFTGNKFELRAVGSSKNSAQPMTALNSAVANQLKNFKSAVDALIAQGKDEKSAVIQELKNVLQDSRNILFEGNNYGDEWVAEAERRGLKNIKNTPESLDAYISETAMDVFVKNKIFTEPELHARHDIMLEEYVKKIQIEGRVLDELFYTYILPPTLKYVGQLANNVKSLKDAGLNPGSSQLELITEISEHVDEAKKLVDKMTDARRSANRITDAHEKAIRYHEDVKESFDKIRYHVDKLEMLVDDNLWKLPKYREMLFIR
jgi:glutamine synthetase